MIPWAEIDLDFMVTLPTPKTVICDCDGVLLETVGMKLRAFRDWVPEEHVAYQEEFCRYNREAFGRSRYVQIQHFYKSILGLCVSDEFLVREVARFAHLVENYAREAPWVDGAQRFLQACRHRDLPVYVLSGTPDALLKDEFERRGASGFFAGIYGAPVEKRAGIDDILRKERCAPTEAWMIGDGAVDKDAARHCGTVFVFRQSELGPVSNPDLEVKSLAELIPLL